MSMVGRERAELYARYRLPYADEAVLAVLKRLPTPQPVVADIGAGTGLLTGHFVGRAGQVYAIEPEPEMRLILERGLGEGCISMHGVAEATGLPERSVDLIVVGNAYHRFDPSAATAEFARILKPDGWLAIISYGFHDQEFGRGHGELLARFPQWRERLARTRHREPAARFFGHGATLSISVRQVRQETWDEYWGGVLGAMEAPDESDSWFEEFQLAHRELFDRCAGSGVWELPYSTEVVLGQPQYR
jgi:SAM-dependent methyltransferase